ncbi:MAG TPA: DUF5317 family protein [Chloroflexota bacterium]
MLVLLVPVVVVLVVATIRVGSLAGLQRLHVQWWPLALGSLAVQLVLFNPPVDRQAWALVWGPWIWVACLVALLAVLVRNALSAETGRTAFGLAALGVGINLVVVLANGGHMPQSTEARLVTRGTPLVTPGAPPQLRNVEPSGPDTRLGWLGDVIPQPAWLPTANVLSIGDIALSIALAWWVFQLTFSPASSRLAAGLRSDPES